jgi:autotransporter adhesin
MENKRVNTIYRIIWNAATGHSVVASELARGRKKGGTLAKVVVAAAVSGLSIGSASAAEQKNAKRCSDVEVREGRCEVDASSFIGKRDITPAAWANLGDGNTGARHADVVTLGTEIKANNNDIIGIGSQLSINAANAIVLGSNHVTVDSQSTGSFLVAPNAYETVNPKRLVNSSNAVAILGSVNNANDGVAVGIGSSVTNTTNGVALGARSVADRANTVSVGSATLQRQVVNVAAGARGTDAVNVNQLTPALTALGAKIDSAGAVTGPAYNVQGRTHNTVGSALTSLNTSVNDLDAWVKLNASDIRSIRQEFGPGSGLVRQDANTNAITLAVATGGKTVSFEGLAGARTLTGVAGGNLSANSTEAVNGSQLFATNQRVATNSEEVRRVGNRLADNRKDIDAIFKDLGSDNVGLVRQDEVNRTVTVAAGTGGALVNVAGIDGARRLTGVANGYIGKGSIDAVNGGQLHDLQQKVEGQFSSLGSRVSTLEGTKIGDNRVRSSFAAFAANGVDNLTLGTVTNSGNGVAIGADSVVRDADGGVALGHKASSGHLGATALGSNTTASGTVSTAIGNNAVASGTGSIAIGGSTNTFSGVTAANADGLHAIAIGENAATAAPNTIALGFGARTTSAGSIALGANAAAEASNSVALGASSRADRANTISVGFAGSDGSASVRRQVVNVAAGTQGNDAVNLNQLTPALTALGATIDSATGAVAGPVYNVQGGTQTTIAGALTALNTGVNGLGNRITVNEGAIRTIRNEFGSGEIGLVKQATNGSITVAGDTGGRTIDLAGTAGARAVSGVANGNLSATSSDAVNGSQLFATNQRVNTVETTVGSINTNVTRLGDRLSTSETSLTSIRNEIGAGNVGLVKEDTSKNAITVAATKAGRTVNFEGIGGARVLTGVANGRLTTGSTEVVNGGQLFATNERVRVNEDGVRRLRERVSDTEESIGAIFREIGTSNVGLAKQETSNAPAALDIVPFGSFARGDGSKASGSEATAIGPQTDASGANSSALGFKANASGLASSAIGSNARATGAGSVALGGSSNGTGVAGAYAGALHAIAIGESSRATRDNAIALGFSATSSGAGAVSLGLNASSTADSSVALGSGSVADRANTVSVGSRASQRQIVNVAAGTQGNDAVNVSQLTSALAAVGATVDATGAVINPTYDIQGGRHATVGGALAALNTGVNGLSDRVSTNERDISAIRQEFGPGSALVKQDANTNAITVAAATVGQTVSFEGLAGARTLTGVAGGNLSANSTEAVNGSQLFATNQRVTANNEEVRRVSNRLADNRKDIDAIFKDLGSDNVGLVRQDEVNRTVTVASGTGGSLVNFAGIDGARRLTGVANGYIGKGSIDAINGGQLHDLQQKVDGKFSLLDNRVSAVEVANTDDRKSTRSTFAAFASDTLDALPLGTVSGSTNGVAIGGESTVTNSFDGVALGHKASAGSASGTIKAATALGSHTEASGIASTAVGNGAVASGTGSIALGGSLNENGINAAHAAGFHAIAIGENSAVAAGASNALALGFSARSTATGSVALGANSVADRANTVSVGSETSHRQLVNVAAGTQGNDAVNVGQLTPALTALGATIDPTTGTVTGPAYHVHGGTHATVGGALAALNTGVDGLGDRVTVNEGAISTIRNDIDAGNVGLVRQSVAGGNITVGAALGGRVVDFTGADGLRTLTGVANGVNDSDAVTIAQLRAVGALDPTHGKLLSVLTYDNDALARATLGGSQGTVVANLANGYVGFGSKEAINGGQLFDLQKQVQGQIESLDGRVSIVEGGIRDGSIGGGGVGNNAGGKPIANVGDGVASTDAANVGQVTKQVNEAIETAKTYADTQFNAVNKSLSDFRGEVNDRFRQVDSKIDRLGAIGAANTQMAINAAGATRSGRAAVGVGYQNGKSAMAVGYAQQISDRTRFSLGGAFSGKQNSVGAGIGVDL